MKLPLEVVYRGMARSEAIDADIRKHAERLEKFDDRVMSCRVMVEQLHRHHHQGNLYHVRVDLKVPGGELVVSRSPDSHHAHEDVYVVIRDAFDATRRRLENHVRRRRGDVKLHKAQPHGRIVEIHPDQAFGRIEASDGRLVYARVQTLLQHYDLDLMSSDKVIHLPPPVDPRGKSVYQSLLARRTIRELSAADLTLQETSNILWAAKGVNRATTQFGLPGLTAASASNGTT